MEHLEFWGTIITGILTLVGVIIANNKSNREIQAKMDKQQAVFEEHTSGEIGALRKEVERHNGVIERVFGLEQKHAVMSEQIKVVNHRIDDLERGKG